MIHVKHKFIIFLFLTFIQLDVFSQVNDSSSFLAIPTGSYKIGTKEIFLTDSSRLESFSKKKKFREFSVKIWYPADINKNMTEEFYINSYPTEIIYETFKEKGIEFSFLDSIKHHKTHSYFCPPISSKKENFPVLIFSSGYFFGMSDLYSCIMENLASNGYIVGCITHPYQQPYLKFPNGEEIYFNRKKLKVAYFQLLIAHLLQFRKRDTQKKKEIITRNTLRKLKAFDKTLKLWVDDSEFFINYLINKSKDRKNFFCKADTSRIGVFGHSFGGAVSGQICQFDKRIKAGINLDCFQFGNIIDNPLPVPFMLIESSSYPDWNMGNEIIYSNAKSDFYKLSLLNARHFIFSDAAVIPFKNQKIISDFIGPINGSIAINTINSYILGFFDLYLNKKSKKIVEEKINNTEMKFDFIHD